MDGAVFLLFLWEVWLYATLISQCDGAYYTSRVSLITFTRTAIIKLLTLLRKLESERRVSRDFKRVKGLGRGPGSDSAFTIDPPLTLTLDKRKCFFSPDN